MNPRTLVFILLFWVGIASLLLAGCATNVSLAPRPRPPAADKAGWETWFPARCGLCRQQTAYPLIRFRMVF